jgi:hypothetical protein
MHKLTEIYTKERTKRKNSKLEKQKCRKKNKENSGTKQQTTRWQKQL